MAARDEDDEEFDLGISLESVAAIVDAARAVQEGEESGALSRADEDEEGLDAEDDENMDEDALRDRVYLPLDLLAAEGVADAPAATLIASPGFARAAAHLAQQAEAGFAQAAAQAAESTRNQIRAARTAAWTARSG